MLVQDTPTSACHAGSTTETGLQAAYLALKPVFELQEKQKNARLALVNVPDVANASLQVSDKQRNNDALATLPRLFDSDDDVCSTCLSRGLFVDDDGELAVCLCMSFDPWAITWIEDMLNRLITATARRAGCSHAC